MVGSYKCLKGFSWPSETAQPRTDYVPGLLYHVRPSNEPLAEAMAFWVREGLFEKVSDAVPAAAVAGRAAVTTKG